MPSDRPRRIVRAGTTPAVSSGDAKRVAAPDDADSAGVSRAEIGKRLRAVRMERKLTLRQLAVAADLSATHISEIERGRTMPTIGALVRLASALGRAPNAFLERRWLQEVSLVRASDPKKRLPQGALAGGAEILTRGIPGGALLCARLVVDQTVPPLTCGGELGMYVLRGTARIHAGDGEFLAEVGDSFHLRGETPATISSATAESTEVLILLSQPETD